MEMASNGVSMMIQTSVHYQSMKQDAIYFPGQAILRNVETVQVTELRSIFQSMLSQKMNLFSTFIERP